MSKFLNEIVRLFTGEEVEVKVPDIFHVPAGHPLKKHSDRELLQMESEIGAKLFGPIPEGGHRDFFCLDAKTWIWHEEWLNEKGSKEVATTRYEIQKNGVLKIQEGARYSYLDGEELRHLLSATQIYYEKVVREIYHRDPVTGLKLEQQVA